MKVLVILAIFSCVFVAESLLVLSTAKTYFWDPVKFTLCLFWRGPAISRAGGQELESNTT